MIRLLWILLLFTYPLTVMAQDNSNSYITITVHYRSMFPGNIQIRDEVCLEPRSIDCEKARIRATGDRCRRNRSDDECKEARALLDSTFCIDGLIYEGRMSQGDEVKVRVCKSYAGYGNVSVRNTTNGVGWTNYPLKTDNAQISYP